MKFFALSSSILGLVATVLTAAPDQYDPSSYSKNDVIKTDIAVVGGGASGTYAAVNLQDAGKKVVLIEKNGRLGGHVNTYIDPKTGTAIDYGTQAYLNNTVTINFFKRLEVPIANFTFAGALPPLYADFSSGQILPNFAPTAGFGADYQAQLNKYSYLNSGFELPKPVPSDLLLPWSQFAPKYNLQNYTYPISGSLAGLGNTLDVLTLYVFNLVNQALLDESKGAAVTTAAHDNSATYEAALKVLGSNAFLNSTVIAGKRDKNSSSTSVKLVINTPRGKKLLLASQLVLGIPPISSNLSPIGLDSKENKLISQVSGTPYFCGLVTNTGLSPTKRYTNAGYSTQYNLPSLPGVFRLFPTLIPEIFLYWYGSLDYQTQPQIESNVAQSISKLQNTTPNATVGTLPQFLAFGNHSPYHPSVSAKAIEGGFYESMYDLQGHRNTWYVGGLFVFSSGQLWNATAALIPQILAATK
ncbi:hypothetical protein MMC10_001570 [Thelotrema lepadinum]|nr:hypothetical protein [Thelotrema lepadinum]